LRINTWAGGNISKHCVKVECKARIRMWRYTRSAIT